MRNVGSIVIITRRNYGSVTPYTVMWNKLQTVTVVRHVNCDHEYLPAGMCRVSFDIVR